MGDRQKTKGDNKTQGLLYDTKSAATRKQRQAKKFNNDLKYLDEPIAAETSTTSSDLPLTNNLTVINPNLHC